MDVDRDDNDVQVPALKHLKQDIGNMLNKALAAIEDGNDSLDGVLKSNIDFNAVKGKTKIPDQKWKDPIDHFNQPNFRLVNENFEFPDLLGAAYEYLIKYFADSTGIPACVLVVNKNKPDELQDKILFINADREYGEGKAQNKLRFAGRESPRKGGSPGNRVRSIQGRPRLLRPGSLTFRESIGAKSAIKTTLEADRHL